MSGFSGYPKGCLKPFRVTSCIGICSFILILRTGELRIEPQGNSSHRTEIVVSAYALGNQFEVFNS